uniref:ABM domain-containing protein n=1 Tax=Bionectria ochroleuca TaxID=29856 RepID=A0A8H7TI00_BIOOC
MHPSYAVVLLGSLASIGATAAPQTSKRESITAFQGVSIQNTAYVAPENVTKYLEAAKWLFDQVIAEPDIVFFEVYQSPEDPGRISWIEDWLQPVEWLVKNQMSKPYYNESAATTGPMLIKPTEFSVVNRIGPEFLYIKT